MEDLVALFKSAPLEAMGIMVAAAVMYWFKHRGERREVAENKAADNREIERLKAALLAVIDERDDERIRADAAFTKQLELTERYSEMRATSEKMSVQMESLSKQMTAMAEQNTALRDQVRQLTEEVHQQTQRNGELSRQVQQLQASLSAGNGQ